MQEHEYEPVPGLPGHLPAGEVLLWQGAPVWRSLARHGFHERRFVLYFAALLVWYAIAAAAREDALEVFIDTSRFAVLAAVAVGIVDLLAFAVARTTQYTITSRRVVMRFGIALPMTINLPFALVSAADVRTNADGSGDLVLTLAAGQKVSWLLLWPHVRPWHLSRVKPMLRCIPEAARAASLLGRALALAHGQAVAPISKTVVRPAHPEAPVTA